MKLNKLSELVDGRLSGDGDIEIESAAPIEKAVSGQISFVANNKYLKYLETATASAVVLSIDTKFDRLPCIKVKDPYYAFALILDALYPDQRPQSGIHPTAVIASTATIDSRCSVGALTYVGENSIIGENSDIMPRIFIGN
ncbi:MAG: LpxD N-terminal domain-containing protein, partial [Candidatus Zixiibacteriota bacterium]